MTPFQHTTRDPFTRPVCLPAEGAVLFHTDDVTLLGSPREIAGEMHARALFFAGMSFRDYCKTVLRGLASNGASVRDLGTTDEEAARALLQSLLDAGLARLRPVGANRN